MTGETALGGILDWEEVGKVHCEGEEDDHSNVGEETSPLLLSGGVGLDWEGDTGLIRERALMWHGGTEIWLGG